MSHSLSLEVGKGQNRTREDVPELVLLEEATLVVAGVDLLEQIVAGVLEERGDAVVAARLLVVLAGCLVVHEGQQVLVAQLLLRLQCLHDPAQLLGREQQHLLHED